MTETVDDLSPLGRRGRKAIAAAKTGAVVIGVLVSSAISAVTAYRSAAGDAQAQAQAVKNKSEAGYQVTRQAMEALEHRVLVLEQAAHRQEQAQATPKRGVRRPPPPIPVAVTPHPKPLPADLDKAERQVYRGVASGSPRPDGGAKER